MAVPAVVAIALALWLFVDRLAGAQMREPLTWDEILTLEKTRSALRTAAPIA